jgi:hypothetical protein
MGDRLVVRLLAVQDSKNTKMPYSHVVRGA